MVARSYARHVTLESRPMLEKVESRTSLMNVNKKEGWELRLTVGQLLISWAIISGMMIAVFFFGFNAGRRDGLDKVLLSRSTSDVRLPIIGAEPPSATPKKYSSIAQSDVATTPSQVDRVASTPDQVIASLPEKGKLDEPVVVDAPTAVVGYSARSAAVAIADTSGEVVVKEKPASEKIATASSGKSGVAAGWYIQVASTRDLKGSNTLKARAADNGLQVVVDQASLRGVSFYQVLVGPYPKKESASAAMEKLKNEKIFQGRLFIKELK